VYGFLETRVAQLTHLAQFTPLSPNEPLGNSDDFYSKLKVSKNLKSTSRAELLTIKENQDNN
jgi:hypothetical protein